MAEAGANGPVCPRCGSSDMSQSTMAIVADQTRFGSGSFGGVGAIWSPSGVDPVLMTGSSTSTSQSLLAEMLDLPAPRRPSITKGCLGTVLLLVGLAFAALGAGAMVYSEAQDRTRSGYTPKADAEVAGLAVAAGSMTGGLPLAFGLALIGASVQQRRRWLREEAGWRRAMPIGTRLIYCARDHVVYDPGNPGACFHPSETRDYSVRLSKEEQAP
jgi:hypothetical protein